MAAILAAFQEDTTSFLWDYRRAIWNGTQLSLWLQSFKWITKKSQLLSKTEKLKLKVPKSHWKSSWLLVMKYLCTRTKSGMGIQGGPSWLEVGKHCLYFQEGQRMRTPETPGLSVSLQVPGKIMEKVVLGVTEKHLGDNPGISHSQHSFMKVLLVKLIAF